MKLSRTAKLALALIAALTLSPSVTIAQQAVGNGSAYSLPGTVYTGPEVMQSRVGGSTSTTGTAYSLGFVTPNAGDLLVVFFGWTVSGSPTITTPSGWTLVTTVTGSTYDGAIYDKVSAGNESTITFASSVATAQTMSSYEINTSAGSITNYIGSSAGGITSLSTVSAQSLCLAWFVGSSTNALLPPWLPAASSGTGSGEVSATQSVTTGGKHCPGTLSSTGFIISTT